MPLTLPSWEGDETVTPRPKACLFILSHLTMHKVFYIKTGTSKDFKERGSVNHKTLSTAYSNLILD